MSASSLEQYNIFVTHQYYKLTIVYKYKIIEPIHSRLRFRPQNVYTTYFTHISEWLPQTMLFKLKFAVSRQYSF